MLTGARNCITIRAISSAMSTFRSPSFFNIFLDSASSCRSVNLANRISSGSGGGGRVLIGTVGSTGFPSSIGTCAGGVEFAPTGRGLAAFDGAPAIVFPVLIFWVWISRPCRISWLPKPQLSLILVQL